MKKDSIINIPKIVKDTLEVMMVDYEAKPTAWDLFEACKSIMIRDYDYEPNEIINSVTMYYCEEWCK